MAVGKRGKRAGALLPEIGSVYAFALPDGRFAVMQVIRHHSDAQVELATLDGMWAALPTAAELRDVRVHRSGLGIREGSEDRVIARGRPPWHARLVAVLPPVAVSGQPCASHGGWYAFGPYNVWRRRELGTAPRRHDMSPIEIDVGGGPAKLRSDTWRIHVSSAGPLRPAADGSVRWGALDALPLQEIGYAGAGAGLVEYLRTRPQITTLHWSGHGERRIDLSGTGLRTIYLGTTDGLEVRVPPLAESLYLDGGSAGVRLVLPRAGMPFSLGLSGKELPPEAIAGAEDVEDLTVQVRTCDARRLGYRRLAKLTLRGSPGTIIHTEALRRHTRLRVVVLHEVYGLDAAAFPTRADAAGLDEVVVDGVEKETATVLARRLADVPFLEIRGARTRAWLAANLGNPFRRWVDDEPRLGRAAMAAWKKASTAVEKLGDAAPRKKAEAVLKALVTTLNRLDKNGAIDTIRREEAGDAFFNLGKRLGVPPKECARWFDTWRDF